MQVAVNVEQLLYRPPGGIGRYTAKLVTLLPHLFPDDQVVTFTARHRRSEIDAAWRAITEASEPAVAEASGERGGVAASGSGGGGPVRLALPRAALYEGWNTLGWPPLPWLAPELADVDVVHAPSVAVPATGATPLVVTVHDVAPALFPEAFPWHGRWFHARGLAAAARRADLVITVSQSAADEVTEHSTISRDRLRVVANGVDHLPASATEVEAAVARHGLAGAPYLLWVGTLEPRKNVATLVRAFAALVEAGQAGDHCLVLAGPSGWLSNDLVPASVLARLAAPGRRGGAGGRVRLLGPVGEADLRALYAGATAFAFPSRHEGFGLPVLEAMAQGTPVVCSDIAPLRELTSAGPRSAGSEMAGPETGGPPTTAGVPPTARLVAPDDVDAWADALGGLIGDESARTCLAQAGRAHAAQFSWERTVRETHGVYAEALAGAG